ncbi:MAG: lysophospholipid acyltransferase family protein [Deltaproteobacteria bacterium]|nr:lysophospholipid acyltransferase family protein [Deltaproteobacteria bacterium]
MDYIIYIVLRGAIAFFNALPHSLALSLGRLMAALVYALMPFRRRMVMENIKKAFGDKLSDAEVLSIVKSFYSKLGMSVAEVARLKSFGPEYFSSHVEFEGNEHADAALKQGKGVVFLSAHFGNWELLSAALALKGYRMTAVARPIDNKHVNRYLETVRRAFGTSIIEKENALRKMIELLKSGGILGILLDQRSSRREGVEVDFFGAMAYTNKGLAALVQRTGSPVVPVFMRRIGTDKHRVMFGKPVEVVSTGDREAYIIENTARFAKAIEKFIALYPDEWFWFHSRWERKKYRR